MLDSFSLSNGVFYVRESDTRFVEYFLSTRMFLDYKRVIKTLKKLNEGCDDKDSSTPNKTENKDFIITKKGVLDFEKQLENNQRRYEDTDLSSKETFYKYKGPVSLFDLV